LVASATWPATAPSEATAGRRLVAATIGATVGDQTTATANATTTTTAPC